MNPCNWGTSTHTPLRELNSRFYSLPGRGAEICHESGTKTVRWSATASPTGREESLWLTQHWVEKRSHLLLWRRSKQNNNGNEQSSVEDIFGAFSPKFKVSEYFTVYYIQTFLNPKVRRPKVRSCRSTINKPIHQQSDSDKGWKQTASKSHYQAVPAVPAVLRTAALPTVGRLFVTIKGCWPARALPAESP